MSPVNDIFWAPLSSSVVSVASSSVGLPVSREMGAGTHGGDKATKQKDAAYLIGRGDVVRLGRPASSSPVESARPTNQSFKEFGSSVEVIPTTIGQSRRKEPSGSPRESRVMTASPGQSHLDQPGSSLGGSRSIRFSNVTPRPLVVAVEKGMKRKALSPEQVMGCDKGQSDKKTCQHAASQNKNGREQAAVEGLKKQGQQAALNQKQRREQIVSEKGKVCQEANVGETKKQGQQAALNRSRNLSRRWR